LFKEREESFFGGDTNVNVVAFFTAGGFDDKRKWRKIEVIEVSEGVNFNFWWNRNADGFEGLGG